MNLPQNAIIRPFKELHQFVEKNKIIKTQHKQTENSTKQTNKNPQTNHCKQSPITKAEKYNCLQISKFHFIRGYSFQWKSDNLKHTVVVNLNQNNLIINSKQTVEKHMV